MAWWFWWPEYNSPSDFCFPILSEDATPKQNLFNGGYYTNSTVNNAINKGFTESDPAKLTAMWRQARTVMGSQDPPWLPLGQIIDTSYLRTDVKGYVANPVYTESYDFTRCRAARRSQPGRDTGGAGPWACSSRGASRSWCSSCGASRW
jgi:ABC-type dipeptide transport system, periplasmic component